MPKETVSARQAICMIILFLFGSSALVGINTDVGQDAWMSLLLGQLYAFPVVAVYARIIRLFPEKDFFDIVEILFGKIFGKVLTALMTWYGVHLAALVIRNFSEFIKIAVMPETPEVMIIIVLMLTVVYMIKSGVETMGRWALIMIFVVMAGVLLTAILSVNKLDLNNLKPYFEHDFSSIAFNAFDHFSFPFAETVMFLGLAGSFRRKDSPFKLYFYSNLLGTAILLIVSLRNILLLGPTMGSADMFPSFTAVSVVDVGGFLARIEGSIALNLILAGIIKITVCLVAASKGVTALFRLQDYKRISFPISALSVALSVILFRNATEMLDFLVFYEFYAVPFQIIIPLLVWIVGEVKSRKNKAGQSNKALA